MSIPTISGFIPGTLESRNKWFSYNVRLTPYLVYHFPIKNNADVFAGGYVQAFIGDTPKSETTERTYGFEYEYNRRTVTKYPLGFGVGAGFMLGTEYYVAKNIAIGLQGTLGFSSSMQIGEQRVTSEKTNSGFDNPAQGSSSTETVSEFRNFDNSLSLQGGVGINMSFFFTRKEKAKKE